ncbi:cobaltochelatase subunit CobN [Candidatus Bathyarchaeota archaeon A05DMB-2]|jgi:cobaltochelatase CobN|nr:cobaltochelatase subunit CobN [Candidatus Bathyarchaeota archaeon A05DMB-2]
MTQIKIAFITTIPTDAVPFIAAVKSINERLGDIVKTKIQIGGDFRAFGSLYEFIEFAQKSHVTLVHLMGDLPDFDLLVSSLKSAGVPLFVSTSFFGQNLKYRNISTVAQDDYKEIFKYLNYGGKNNLENLLLYLANRFTGANYEVKAPEQPPWEGIYHPEFKHPPTIDEYIAKKIVPGRPTIGIWFHQTQWQGENTSFVDDLIEEAERQGANVLPVFFSGAKNEALGIKGLEWIIENYLTKEGKPIVDVVISALSFSLTTSLSGSASITELKKLGVPIIKAILTCNTYEEWRDTMQGLSIIDIPSGIAMPEFDGLLITVPIAAMAFSQANPLGTKIIQYEPIPERVAKLVSLSINWAKLRHIPNSEKKVAIILHNYPPRNDTIGHAFGLDAPVSVHNILRDLSESGYKLDSLPKNGQELIETIINGLTNDRRWLSAEELAERAVAKISKEQYSAWFNELPVDVQTKMRQDWGDPPGKLFSCNGELLVAGIINGNVFIGLQPPRGFLENPSSIYHSPDISMPHHYYAYYRWIRNVFKANVIMHIGTHGTLEWLPGKSVGLSASCFPDIAISDLPNIYPYVITNPGEGTQAKRRSYCCIIEHLVPVMHNADTYEELAKLQVQLQDYYHTKTTDPSKLQVSQKLIWETVVQAKLDRDLEVIEESAFSNFDAFLERLHAYINELSDAQIRDGLHTLGEPPTDSRLDEFIVTLTRLNNGGVPSLRQSIAEMKGYDYEDLLANRGKLNAEGRTNGDVIKELHELSLELIRKFHAKGFKEQDIDSVMQEVLGGTNPNVRRCLVYISSFLVPALEATTDELTNTLVACEGTYVSPGPSGSVTRGMADILPTGRNFYSVDPRAVPSQASWRVGVALGDALLERYLKEEGKYPESVGIVIWATDTMKTKGDDIAEILYLMGVKPIWEETSGRVIGIESIPLEVLKRPRIDVIVRISGLFRDTFPNIVHIIDDAVALVASLKEPAEQNYIAKHVEAEVKERVDQGVDLEKAKEEAHYRIFGDRPGAYGCGVSEAVDAKNWRDQKDLSDIYVTWGSYAYSRKTYGCSVPEQFKRRLSSIDVTVKNQDSREYDILDGDDWYDAHGGMINAVRTLKGKAPRSYCGDSSDPNRVKVRSTAEETCYVFRSRLLNPKWIESMMRHGYEAAGDFSRTFDFVLGWDATVEVVEDWMWEELAEKYVFDKKVQEWLKEVNPYALQNMIERLLEAIERNLWQATEEMKKKLQKSYLDIEGLLEGASEKKSSKEK